MVEVHVHVLVHETMELDDAGMDLVDAKLVKTSLCALG